MRTSIPGGSDENGLDPPSFQKSRSELYASILEMWFVALNSDLQISFHACFFARWRLAFAEEGGREDETGIDLLMRKGV
jgi:hypothetical protein